MGPKSAAQTLETCRVIILSGNKFTCQLVRTLLPGLGIKTIEVSHEPGHAETQLATWVYDLIIADAGPAAGFDWLALVEWVRTLPDSRQVSTPAILLVSQPTKEIVTRAAAAKIRDIIVKPFAAGSLYEHVKRALGLASYAPSTSHSLLAAKEPASAPDLIV